MPCSHGSAIIFHNSLLRSLVIEKTRFKSHGEIKSSTHIKAFMHLRPNVIVIPTYPCPSKTPGCGFGYS